MEPELTLQLILQHLIVSLVPWSVAMLVAGGLGYAFASSIRRWGSSHTARIRFLEFLPWRSVSVWIALINIYSPLSVWQLGIGVISAGVAIGVTLSLFIIVWTTFTLLQTWYPNTILEKILSIARLSAITSIALAVFLSAGMGYYISQVTSANDVQKMFLGYAVVGAMMLGVDILFGLVEHVILVRANPP